MASLRISIGPLVFIAQLEERGAPRTCEELLKLCPLRGKILQDLWSGEAAWAPLNTTFPMLDMENAISDPAVGELLLYRGGIREAGILFPFGSTIFKNEMDKLVGNHFATILDGHRQMDELGHRLQWEGAQDIVIEFP